VKEKSSALLLGERRWWRLGRVEGEEGHAHGRLSEVSTHGTTRKKKKGMNNTQQANSLDVHT